MQIDLAKLIMPNRLKLEIDYVSHLDLEYIKTSST
jgi:hypothetical protein